MKRLEAAMVADMCFQPDRWTRLEAFDRTPVYVRPEDAEWFVPNPSGDRVLRSLQPDRRGPLDFEAERFIRRLPPGAGDAGAYTRRGEVLTLYRLSELWLHVTDRCNLACRHCLFSCGGDTGDTITSGQALGFAREAADLGCRLFALTGGEPLVHPRIVEIVRGLLALGDSRVVLLTNGLLLDDFSAALTSWPHPRLHLQLSLDGLEPTHDRIRGRGNFQRVVARLAALRDQQVPCTLSVAVGATNRADVVGILDLAEEVGVSNMHFMWHFERGRGQSGARADPGELFETVTDAAARAEAAGIVIDNLDALRSQVFAPGGTRHDGTSAAWESLAIGPDARLYPSAAMIGLPGLATPIDTSLEQAWRTGAVLDRLRERTVAGQADPLRFLTGGGDPDHRQIHGGSQEADDPYRPLIERLALWLIAREARAVATPESAPGLILKRGEVLESCGADGAVALTHSGCLLSVADGDSRTPVREFYRQAAETSNAEILNPAAYPEALIDHVPEDARLRSYGCGSPVIDARPRPGERLLDLGSGTGVECFIAARLVGAGGRVTGVDMLAPMLARAERGARAVAGRLGYANVRFERGFLEALPLSDESNDVVISNCVINLSVNKRRTFREILRVLRPGGRLVVSDVVCETEPPAGLRNDEQLRGECIAGALPQRDLFGLLRETGFVSVRVIRRFPYRVVGDHPFFSLTYEARKPTEGGTARVIYRGPFDGVWTHAGTRLPVGQTIELSVDEIDDFGQSLLRLGQDGEVTNLDLGAACCGATPEAADAPSAAGEEGAPAPLAAACQCPPEAAAPRAGRPVLTPPLPPAFEWASGCMVCGEPLEVLARPGTTSCEFCGATHPSQTRCRQGHFVCDACHARDALGVLEHLCGTSEERDLISMLREVRRHPAIHVHGPEHHALVPAIIVACYRNLGGEIPDGALRTAIDRGAQVPGGFCGFAGTCGAAIGVGIGLSTLLGATPYTAARRQQVQRATSAALALIADCRAPRCCQRDCYLALRSAAESSAEMLPVTLAAAEDIRCSQVALNEECVRASCPLYTADC